MAKVKVNYSGHCDGYHFVKGVEVELPEKVLDAIGPANYIPSEKPKAKEPEQTKDEGKKEANKK